MTTYVLVPGFWLGSWAWQEVASAMRAAGHTVHPLTLTGLAERSHLASPVLTTGTHIDDITNLLAFEDLRDVVLVGHSGAGAAVTGAADRAAERIARVVFLESGPVPDGAAQIDLTGRDDVESGLVDGWRYPMRSWEEFTAAGVSLEGLGPRERALMAGRATDQPLGTITQQLSLSGAFEKLPKALISCSFPVDQVRGLITSGHPLFASLSGPEWELHGLPTGHWPMLSRPADLAALLGGIR
ncbi:alpha/beta fold hydrolase [Planotetraspora thailandica]|nr:alpha/beta fold hydrolase [Planotetraspora thailandica]